MRGIPNTQFHSQKNQIGACIDWIHLFFRTGKKPVKSRTTYSYKHYVQSWCGKYVSNEAFIEAARQLGIKMAPAGNGQMYLYGSYDLKAMKAHYLGKR